MLIRDSKADWSCLHSNIIETVGLIFSLHPALNFMRLLPDFISQAI